MTQLNSPKLSEGAGSIGTHLRNLVAESNSQDVRLNAVEAAMENLQKAIEFFEQKLKESAR